jgi:hypothetical protein
MTASATVIKLRPKLRCSQCNATQDAACDCGVAYLPAGKVAEAAVAANPERSDRAIAWTIGVSSNTVRRARQRTAPDGAVTKTRTGRDGKSRRIGARPPKTIRSRS